ncbi:MAG: PEGA domain-containing protein [Smithella sp.]|nr:PEGA domain-containing protein [Smithella sp.]
MKKLYLGMGAFIIFVMGCSQPVLRQDIPVSTNPLGAKIYANGQFVGTTPTSVSLERDRNHILTLVKDSYRQEDVAIQKSYQKEKVYLNAISSGINSGLFFKNAGMGIGGSMSSISAQEKTGEAYVLVPPVVKINLTPVAGSALDVTDQQQAPQSESSGANVANPDDSALDEAQMARGLAKIGAAAALSQAKPLEKNVETSSSSKSYIRPDGTRVTEKSSTSVGVSVNPAALINALDVLFK